MATGEYIKFLNDDDMLHLSCVERMAQGLSLWPDITLVTSHRQCIDSKGNPLSEMPATKRPVEKDSIIDGPSLANAVLATQVNFIGEPSTVMFRKEDLLHNRPNILSFAGRPVTWDVDFSIVNFFTPIRIIWMAIQRNGMSPF